MGYRDLASSIFVLCFCLIATCLMAIGPNATVSADEQPGNQPAVDAEHAANMKRGLAVFRKDVRPVLIGRCVKCHGGESSEAELDLNTREALLKGSYNGPVVVPGKASESRFYKVVAHTDEPFMPEDGAKLNERTLAAIAKWIDLGAPYDKPLLQQADDPLAWTRRQIDDSARDFWSFQPLAEVGLPAIDSGWVRTPADRFVLSKLNAEGLSPNAVAAKRVLIRRAYFDLIGLPPTPDEIAAFLEDTSADAYERLIDRLLDSEHYGERWGRHWLDVARFGESHGFEQDYDRPHAYHYRDFVIKALNHDMPYDQFVRWQIAGDELAPDEPLAMMATGFLGAGVFPTQLTEKEFEPARYDELDDMAGTLGTAMLGLTIGCARCHDHKFDPIPSADYYRLISTFATTIRSNIDLELHSEQTQQALKQWQAEHDTTVDELAKFEANELPGRFDAWLKRDPKQTLQQPTWLVLDPVEAKSAGGATFSKLDDGSLLASGTNPDFDTYTFVAHTNLTGITAVRLEALAHNSMVRGGPGRAANGNIGLGNFSLTVEPLNGPAKPESVRLTNPRATFQQNAGNLSIAASIDDDKKTGWAVDPQFGKDHAAVFELSSPTGFAGGTKLTFTLEFQVNNRHNIGRPRLSITTAPGPVDLKGEGERQETAELLALLEKANGDLTPPQRSRLLNWYKRTDEQWQQRNRAVQDSLAKKPKPQTTKVMVTSEGFKPIPHHADGRGFPHFYEETYFLKRGDATQKQGVASLGFLQALGGSAENLEHWQESPPDDWRTSYRRTTLANWITDTERGAGNLLARVIVNRLWQHHFGRGIVSTPNDFGFQGQRPTHPELLDWLAGQLIENDWRLKPLHKLIMTSAAYMQSSELDTADADIDPENRWLWRFEPRRLEAEVIRDSMLAVSGQLDETMFGPGTLNESMKRRSIYFMIKRSKLIPMLQIFDFPEPLVSQGDRPSTTIAPQALMFMNNENVRGYALAFAKKLEPAAEASLEAAIDAGYETALGREPSEAERRESTEFVRQQLASYQSDRHAQSRQMALADFCQVLMSLNEFVFVE